MRFYLVNREGRDRATSMPVRTPHAVNDSPIYITSSGWRTHGTAQNRRGVI
jgi:hypothetical protein